MLLLASTVLSEIGVRVSCGIRFVYESGSETRTPRDEGGVQECSYLIAEDRDTNVSFLIDPRMVDLRQEFHLSVMADKEGQGIDATR